MFSLNAFKIVAEFTSVVEVINGLGVDANADWVGCDGRCAITIR